MFTTHFLALRPLALVALLALASFGLAACDDGPAEEAGSAAGAAIDDAAEAVGDAVEDAGDAVENATD